MKRKLIKSLSGIILVFSLLVPLSLGSFATTNEKSQPLTKEQQAIIDVIKSNKTQYEKETLFKQILENNELECNALGIPKIVVIDNNQSISFNPDGTFSVSLLQESPQVQNIVNARATSSSTYRTKNYTHTVTRHGKLGNKLFSISVTGYFTGTKGKTPKAHLVNAHYTRGTLSVWQVSNWEKGATGNTCYGRGNFHYGFEYHGSGVIIQDRYENVKLWCTKDLKLYGTR